MRAFAMLVLGLGMGTAIGRYLAGEYSFWLLIGLAVFCVVMFALTAEESKPTERGGTKVYSAKRTKQPLGSKSGLG